MVQHCDYVTQVQHPTDDGTLRPDLVVRLAGGKHVVVDAKVPFAGFLDATDADDEDERGRPHLRRARPAGARPRRRAGGKSYWGRFAPSPEFVVMFVPGEAFLSARARGRPGAARARAARQVMLATPSTLIALLRTVAYAWRQERLADNAREVLALGRELHGRLPRWAATSTSSAASSAPRWRPTTGGRLAGDPGPGDRPPARDLQVVDEPRGAAAGVDDVPRPIAAPSCSRRPDAWISVPAPRARLEQRPARA